MDYLLPNKLSLRSFALHEHNSQPCLMLTTAIILQKIKIDVNLVTDFLLIVSVVNIKKINFNTKFTALSSLEVRIF